MSYTLITKAECPTCDAAKQILNYHKVPFTELQIGRDITREAVVQQYPQVQFAPIIIKDGIQISFQAMQLLLEKVS